MKSLGLAAAVMLFGATALAQPNGVPGQIQQLQQQLAQMQAQVTALSSQVSGLQSSLVTQGSQIWVVADCNNGGSINGALQSAGGHAGPLGVFVLGVCHESVVTGRSNTTILGGTSDAGISPPSTNNPDGLDVYNAVNFTIQSLTFTGASGGAALGVWQSNVTLNNVTISNNSGSGLIAWHSNVETNNLTVSNNAQWGIFDIDGSSVDLNQATLEGNTSYAAAQVQASRMAVNGGSIENNNSGIQVVGGGSLTLQGGALIANNQGQGLLLMASSSALIGQATIQSNSGTGISAQGGSSIVMGWGENPVTIQNNGGGGVYLEDTAVAIANGPDSAVIQGNPGGGINCDSATGAPAAQVEGPASGFVLSGNGSVAIGCPTKFNP